MRFIFWTNSWDDGVPYLETNKSLQDISRTHAFYFMNSGNKSAETIKKMYNGHCIDCENDKAVKGKILFDLIKSRNDYDCLVRIDLDAIIFDLNGLLAKIENNIKDRHAVLGNVKKFNGRKQFNRKYKGIKYVRGACNATSRSVIEKIDMITEENAGFDIPYAMSFHKTKCELISCKLFELNESYTGKLPVWHPVFKGEDKFRIFLKESARYGKA